MRLEEMGGASGQAVLVLEGRFLSQVRSRHLTLCGRTDRIQWIKWEPCCGLDGVVMMAGQADIRGGFHRKVSHEL